MMGVAMPDTVLRQGVHDRLIQDIDAVAAMSRVPVSMIKTSSAKVLSQQQINYIAHFRKIRAEGDANLYLSGELKASPEKVMMGMAAALIRNFIDARVFPLQAVLEEGTEAQDPSVVFVPNFQSNFVGKPLASHQLQRLYSILLDRMVHDKVTVIYVENLKTMATQYGTAITEFVEKNYNHLKGK